MELQPLLHDLLAATMAPTQAWSGHDGQIRAVGAQGVYQGDLRVLSQAVLTVDGHEPEPVAAGPDGPGVIQAVSLLRSVDEPGADPTVRLRRTRTVTPGAVRERLEVTTGTAAPVDLTLTLTLACDLAEMEPVKAGRTGRPQVAHLTDDGLAWSGADAAVHVTAPGALIGLEDPRHPELSWRMTAAPGVATTVTWELGARTPQAVVVAGPQGATWSTPEVTSDDRRLPALVGQALDDLSTLRMSAAFAPTDVFLAAGAPWFFTLFGRDSLWAARMMLPLGTELAAGTLRTLAARQGTVVDVETAEQPGKILHEVRSKPLPLGDGDRVLPPLYYGTVDATPLFVCLLHDAWRWGMPAEEVSALLPAMEAALGWMRDHGDADGDGFLEYLDEGGRGLANQGWKDSGDSVQWRDGRLATGPIALCEVQAYAHEAARAGADLLDAFGRPGAEAWRAWAADLAVRFRESFWVTDDEGAYPAIALDADKKPVDTLTSNIGHLLGTGLLDAQEEAEVARRLGSASLDSGYGLRTLSTGADGYWPLRYHGGAVWTHDTAIAVAGLARSGHTAVAAALAEGLLAAGSEVGYRLPELHGGDARGTVPSAVPYPAACRPQAWSAASAVVLLVSGLGLVPDVPGGTLQVSPTTPSPFGATRIRGLRIAGHALDIEVDAAGHLVEVRTQAPLGLR
ncbi:glycogen debranching N-terminal domain-containing protein [Actinotalea sp. K2]|uniref:amylo-alpha-1,6-glucosidase n=1 Tax=Actinotalea sp. K2 TaxID=2939438 RepID=UPI0020172503|nr:glycogen debranching N-terminal domain-containing protein [Actinotalea sp. K2]MCL3862215.1 amylo-alpha-1,6-glucosidase [Actinotalea sp. K2]